MTDLVPVSALTTMLIASLTLLVVTQLPSTMISKRSRILIGLTSSIILGLGILILKGVLPLFACILSIIAILPKMRWQIPLIIGCVLALAHVSRRLIFDDLTSYYNIVQVNVHVSINLCARHFRKIFSLTDCCGDRVLSGCHPRRDVLQDPNNDGPSQDFLRHEDGDRVTN